MTVSALPTAAPAARPRPLTRTDKILYSLAGIGNNALFWSQSLWLIYFYAGRPEGVPVRISLGVVGIALAIGKVIEVFDDPVIGWWSDRTRTRFGRRIPFLLLGTPLLGLSFWLLWLPPVAGSSWVNVVWFFVVVELFFLARTVVEAPYEALQAEIASTSTERVSLGAWKVAFSVGGVVIGLVVSPLLISAFGYSGMGVILAGVAVVSLYAMLFGLWRRGTLNTPEAPIERPPLFRTLLGALRNRPFLVLAGSFMLFNLGYQMLIIWLPFYLLATFGRGEGDVFYFTAGITVFSLMALPGLAWAARRATKRALYAGSMALLGAYLVVISVGLFVQLGGLDLFIQAVALVALAGLGFSAMWIFPGAMIADIIDEDTRRTGHGRAAIFYGMFKTLEKLAQAGAAAVLPLMLVVFGDTAERPLGLQLAVPVAGIAILGGFALVWLGYHQREAPRDPLEATVELAVAGAS
jgi:glycoside/pentoside/hexuronide:cation symporter, GPH family